MSRAKGGVAVSIAAMGLLLVTSGAVRADAFEDCRNASGAQARLTACSEVIRGTGFGAEQKAVAYRNRGRLRAEAGALDGAIADLGEALKIDANDGQALLSRAQVRVARGDGAGAIADFTSAIRLKPSAVALSGRGHAALVTGDIKAAIEDFTAALQLNPKSATAHNNRGLALKAAGRLEEAIADFTGAIAINPLYATAYNNRAYVHEAAGRKAQAVADFRNALLADPSLSAAREGLQRLGATAESSAESERRVAEGKALVETHCKGCHATGRDGDSPNAKAPPFRTLHARHPMQALREPLTRGIAAPHDEMPKFRLPDVDVDKVVAYINSLETRR